MNHAVVVRGGPACGTTAFQKVGVGSERVSHEIHEDANTGSVAQILMGQQPQIEPEIFRKHGDADKVGACGRPTAQGSGARPIPALAAAIAAEIELVR
jgi:hypothetical protein